MPTLNGFPYGDFHGRRIKEQVYLPDWRSRERVAYTVQLANLLSGLLPNEQHGSISTVPLGFAACMTAADLPLIKANLLTTLYHLEELRQQSGTSIALALEPEPGCWLETSEDLCRFFAGLQLPTELADLLGVCFDCCHHAVEFEEPAAALDRLNAAGIPIAKVQISSALMAAGLAIEELRAFAEPTYLHQVVIRRPDGKLCRYTDLPEALQNHPRMPAEEWRCHFHVPIFFQQSEGLKTTQAFLIDVFPHLSCRTLFEIETYTWEVLPPELRSSTVDEDIIRELLWLKERVDAAHRRP